MKWFPSAAALACAVLLAAGGAQAQLGAGVNGYADESRDWGIAPTDRLRQPPYHGPTPLQIAGAEVVHTRQLQALLAGPESPVLIDVLSDGGHATLAGAVWLSGAGRGANFLDPVQSVLAQLLAQLTRGDKARPVVFSAPTRSAGCPTTRRCARRRRATAGSTGIAAASRPGWPRVCRLRKPRRRADAAQARGSEPNFPAAQMRNTVFVALPPQAARKRAEGSPYLPAGSYFLVAALASFLRDWAIR